MRTEFFAIACLLVLLPACTAITDFSDCDIDEDCPSGACESGICTIDEPDASVENDADGSTASDECELYCDRMESTCPAVFDSAAECLSACAEYPSEPGDIIDGGPLAFDDNTVQCRNYHVLNAVADAATHCPHASPDGGGVCVDFKGSCGVYCGTVVEACPTNEGSFEDVNECENECNLWPEGVEGEESGNTRQCRLTYALRAETDPTNCDLALSDSAACR